MYLLYTNSESLGHTLIIPKNHTLDFDFIDDDTLYYILKIAKKIKKLLELKLNIEGISFVQNNGISEVVKHYHLHLIPNYSVSENLSLEEVYKKIMS